jgi:endonuclease YncB( thermonuclease family)
MRLPRHVAILGVLLLCLGMPASSVTAQTASCSSFDAWEWAQSVFDSDPQANDALDPDGDGIACPELPRGGFASAFWTDSIPTAVEEAQIVRLIDGDTLEVTIDGVSNRVRIYRADTPETQNEQHCGGQEATNFAEFALSFNDNPGVIYLERDENTRDQYGRELAYVWFESGGDPYMLNHILINNGWAQDVDYGDRKYDQQFKDAAAFAQRHDLGVPSMCDGWEQPVQVEPTAAPPPTQAPAPEVPDEPAEQAPSNGGCDPNYTPCIPAYPPDLDCGDIGMYVTVIGSDPHGLDRDNDGGGCESYG